MDTTLTTTGRCAPRRGGLRRAARGVTTLVVTVVALTALSSCGSSGATHQDAAAFRATVATAGTVTLDVRTAGEYASGHLRDAVNVDVESDEFATQIGALDKTVTYALYCRSGNRSGVAMAQMDAAGFTHLVDLVGGIGAWTAAGGSLVVG